MKFFERFTLGQLGGGWEEGSRREEEGGGGGKRRERGGREEEGGGRVSIESVVGMVKRARSKAEEEWKRVAARMTASELFGFVEEVKSLIATVRSLYELIWILLRILTL